MERSNTLSDEKNRYEDTCVLPSQKEQEDLGRSWKSKYSMILQEESKVRSGTAGGAGKRSEGMQKKDHRK